MATGRVTNPSCSTCRGTGRLGGYYDPVSVWLDTSVDSKIVQHLGWGEVHSHEIDVWGPNYPVCKERDILQEAVEGKMYRVNNVRMINPSKMMVQQVMRIVEISRSDVEYTLPSPIAVRQALIEKMNYRKSLPEW